MLTAIAIYHIAPLELPVEVKKIDNLRCAYLWAGCDKVTSGKCKVNWELVYKPKIFGGLGILNLEKFSTALRLRWLWYEWADPPKTWVEMGTPCNDNDRDIFAAATTVHIGDGRKAKFWESSWLEGMRPKDIAPRIFHLSKKKSCLVQTAIPNNYSFSQSDTHHGITQGR